MIVYDSDDSQNYHQLLSTIKRVVKRLKETRDSRRYFTVSFSLVLAPTECKHRKQNIAWMNFSRRKWAAAYFVFLHLLEELTENESGERW